jgi:hypothetical protein
MQPPYKAREHIYDEIQVPLVGAAPVVIGVRKRQNQAFRTWSAVAAGVLLIGLVATVLTAGDLAGDDASIQSQAKTSESKAPRAAASLRQLLKEHDRRSVPSVPLMTLQRGRSMTFYDFISASFPSLQATDVKRARACGPGKTCHYHAYASLDMHTDLAQYKKEKDTLIEKQAVHKTADTKTGKDFVHQNMCHLSLTSSELQPVSAHSPFFVQVSPSSLMFMKQTWLDVKLGMSIETFHRIDLFALRSG